MDYKPINAMKGRLASFTLAIALILPCGVIAPVYGLNVDLSSYLVRVSSGFDGSQMLLFGSAPQDGGDLVVIVKGPPHDVVIRHQGRVLGLNAIDKSLRFENITSFYAFALSDSHLLDSLSEATKQRYQIGLNNLILNNKPRLANRNDASYHEFSQGLLRLKTANGTYQPQPLPIERRGDNLFRVTINFPGNVPIGTYSVETLLIHDGEILQAQVNPLYISKVGLNSKIFYLAHRYPALFGLAAIAGAMLAGLIAHRLFRGK